MILQKSDSIIDRATIELTLNLPIAALSTIRAIDRDLLALGLCCCERSPRLVALLVKYYSHHYGATSDYPWDQPPVTIPDSDPACEDKREILRLITVFPVEKLTKQIQTLFPLRQQGINNTTGMLIEFGICFETALEEYGIDADLGAETLAMMWRKYIELGS